MEPVELMFLSGLIMFFLGMATVIYTSIIDSESKLDTTPLAKKPVYTLMFLVWGTIIAIAVFLGSIVWFFIPL